MLQEELINQQQATEQVTPIPRRLRGKENNVDHPSHYEKLCSMECIEAMEIAFGVEAIVHFCKGNAFKYLWRYKNKGNSQEDLQKALWYCNYGLEKEREFVQDLEFMDEQIDIMRNKIYIYLEQIGVNKGA